MPQIKTEDILTKLNDIDRKIDKFNDIVKKIEGNKQMSLRLWGLSIGAAFMIPSLVILSSANVLRTGLFGAIMLLCGVIIVCFSVLYKSKT